MAIFSTRRYPRGLFGFVEGVTRWQNRVFAVPPAMGIDYRCVNGYIYISGNPVLDPEKIAERRAEAKARGYTTTMFGRRRQLPELSSDKVRVKRSHSSR